MSRRQRRALARFLGVAAPDDITKRLTELERENARLKADLGELTGKIDQVPGVREERRDWFVLVGGERVELKAIPPSAWIESMEELPSFLFAFSVERVTNKGGQLGPEVLSQIHELASRWIRACAVNPDALQLDRLTLPEAEHAVVHISDLNGVTAHMRKWFRDRLDLGSVAGTSPGGQELRAAPQRPAGDKPN